MKQLLGILVIISFTISISYSQEVIKVTKTSGSSLQEQVKSTYNIAKKDNDFFIGYSIETNNKYNISIGSYSLFDDDVKISLRDIIEMTPRYTEFKKSYKKSNNNISGRSVHILNGMLINDKEVDKEIAILFRYDRNSRNVDDFKEISICNMSTYLDLEGYPLYWLDKNDAYQSAEFVINMFDNAESDHVREELVSAIGIHTNQILVLHKLRKIVYNNENDDMTEDALFWIGMQNNKEALGILKNAIGDNKFGELREHAVMALSYIESDEATDELIKITKTNINNELREHAIYSLGNKAVEKAEEALKDFIENDPDIEIKKRAIYALAERSDEIIPYLINIAKSHKSLTIRKIAIYSLSNSEDERAIDALITLVKK